MLEPNQTEALEKLSRGKSFYSGIEEQLVSPWVIALPSKVNGTPPPLFGLGPRSFRNTGGVSTLTNNPEDRENPLGKSAPYGTEAAR